MAQFELEKIPLSKVLETVRELISQGYDPKHYLGMFLLSDDGARLRKA